MLEELLTQPPADNPNKDIDGLLRLFKDYTLRCGGLFVLPPDPAVFAMGFHPKTGAYHEPRIFALCVGRSGGLWLLLADEGTEQYDELCKALYVNHPDGSPSVRPDAVQTSTAAGFREYWENLENSDIWPMPTLDALMGNALAICDIEKLDL